MNVNKQIPFKRSKKYFNRRKEQKNHRISDYLHLSNKEDVQDYDFVKFYGDRKNENDNDFNNNFDNDFDNDFDFDPPCTCGKKVGVYQNCGSNTNSDKCFF